MIKVFRVKVFRRVRAGMQKLRPPQKAGAGSINLLIATLCNRFPRNKNNVPAGLDRFHPEARCFAQTTLDPIAADSIADPVADGKAEAAVGQTVGQPTQYQ